MEEFEADLVDAFNHWFKENDKKGIAYRLKQAKFTSQIIDVLVDSEDIGYLGIEAKSIKLSSTNKLYFSQHFSESEDGHQVERITDFLERSGRDGYLAVEVRRGRGRSRKAYMIPWSRVIESRNDSAGIPVSDFGEIGVGLERDSAEYVLDGVGL